MIPATVATHIRRLMPSESLSTERLRVSGNLAAGIDRTFLEASGSPSLARESLEPAAFEPAVIWTGSDCSGKTYFCAGTYVGSCVVWSITEPYALIFPSPSTTRRLMRALYTFDSPRL